MNGSQKLLIGVGLGLVAISMLYGFYYAVFDEHQTLEKIGLSMAGGFANAAAGNLAAAHESLQTYAGTRIEYLREVHGHSHMAALGTLLIILGLFLERAIATEGNRRLIAWVMVIGAVCLPLGAWLDVMIPAPVPKGLSIIGTFCLVLGMASMIFSLLFASPDKDD
ncbi:MAG: hypothetical protein AAES65_04240 [Candidatus Thiodiazotropha sp. (ex. Lucinoma kazani)]